jgi:hypothetical protein
MAQHQEHEMEWRSDALCFSPRSAVTLSDFFYEGRLRGANKLAHERRLRAVCAVCPVREQCDDLAESTEVEDGYYAGVTIEERIARRRHPT